VWKATSALPVQALFSHFLGTLQAACTPVQLGTGADYRRIHPGALVLSPSGLLSGLERLEHCGCMVVVPADKQLLPFALSKASAWDHACCTLMRRCQSR